MGGKRAYLNETNKIIPIIITEIKDDDLFPIKYKYCGKKYKDIIFSTTKSKIIPYKKKIKPTIKYSQEIWLRAV